MAIKRCLPPCTGCALPASILDPSRVAQTDKTATADTSSIPEREYYIAGDRIMNVIKAIYTFVVGDIIILMGVLLIVGILILIKHLSILAPLRIVSGGILIIAVLAVLVVTLIREALSKH